MFEENTNRGRAASGSNRNLMEIHVVDVDLAKLSSIWQGGWTNMGRWWPGSDCRVLRFKVYAVKIWSYLGRG